MNDFILSVDACLMNLVPDGQSTCIRTDAEHLTVRHAAANVCGAVFPQSTMRLDLSCGREMDHDGYHHGLSDAGSATWRTDGLNVEVASMEIR